MHPQADIAVIECRSRAQAHDWSLVLISQGIESVIVERTEDGAWLLEVAAGEESRAVASITAYERENATVWRRELKWTGLLFDARAVFWFAALVLFHMFAQTSQTDLKAAGLMDRNAVLHGEWWRLFTAIMLHADVAHLTANVTTGIIFLGLAMGCYGAGHALLLSLLGGALGNVATFAVHDEPFRSLGASGMVMASLGLLTAHSLAFAREEKPALWIGRGVIAGCLLVVLLGFSPRSDVVAHVGGFIGGLGLGVCALPFGQQLMRPRPNLAALLVCCSFVLTTWWQALR
jgi:rhomboid protease GluP